MAKSRLAILGMLAVLVVSGCTGAAEPAETTSPPASTTTTTAPVAGAVATEEFRVCMAEGGVELDEIPLDGDGRPRLEIMSGQLDYSDPAVIAALSECAGILSEGALDLGYDDAYREAVTSQLAAFSRCLRARGVEGFPDPIPGFIGIGSPYPTAEIPYNDPELPGAVVLCQGTVFGGSALAGG